MVLAIWLVKAGAPLYLRSVVFVPFMFGSAMLLQSMYRTCIVHALLHRREGPLGVERVANPEQVRADTSRARRVFATSAAVSTLATVVLLIVP
jgi:hypothetical protein